MTTFAGKIIVLDATTGNLKFVQLEYGMQQVDKSACSKLITELEVPGQSNHI